MSLRLISPSHPRAAAIALLATAILVGSVVSLVWSLRRSRDTRYDPLYRAFGEITAEEVIKHVGDRGRVLIYAFDLKNEEDATQELALRAFQKYLRQKAPSVQVAGTELVGLPVLFASTRQQRAERLDEFLAMLDRHATLDAVVCFAGVTELDGLTLPGSDAKRPKIICASIMGKPPAVQFMDAGMVSAAIVSRARSGPVPAGLKSSRAWFDEFYQVITPTEGAALR